MVCGKARWEEGRWEWEKVGGGGRVGLNERMLVVELAVFFFLSCFLGCWMRGDKENTHAIGRLVPMRIGVLASCVAR